ncbi:MAG: hypothetical protein JW976_09320 [Syntrophaceae bacterium]|nr:hypothetical protein [Syntrophaceae bacterium]
MTTTQSIFILFYAIFWGSIASVQGRWKMFHWPLIKYPHVAARLALSTLMLNVLPIMFFALAFYMLRNTPVVAASQWNWCETLQQVFAGVVPAFAVFGFYRLWLAAVEFWPTLFYQRIKHQDEAIEKIDPTIEELRIGSKYGRWNLPFALLYLFIATVVPWLLTR